LPSRLVGLRTSPYRIKGLFLDIAEGVIHYVAWSHIAIGVYKERVGSHGALQTALGTVHMVDDSHGEVCPEPVLEPGRAEVLAHQLPDFAFHQSLVVDEVVGFVKIVGVMEDGVPARHNSPRPACTEAQVPGVVVRNSHRNSQVLDTQSLQALQCLTAFT
jgi:hypothetical protein